MSVNAASRLNAAAVEPIVAAPHAAPGQPLKILHVLRAPLGGLFRHVVDLAYGQAARGHQVGLIVDSTTGGARAESVLAELMPHMALGVARVAIARQLGPSDWRALRFVAGQAERAAPDVVHGHGAKGAALARLAVTAPSALRVYTPHGGSLVYRPGTIAGGFYRTLEWLLKWRTDLFLFESAYVASMFRGEIGRPPGMVRVVRNGVGEAEFAPVVPATDATDVVCLGELRPVKAFDVLIQALGMLKAGRRPVTATIAGDGPDGAALKALAARLEVADLVRFVGHRTAREAFAMGRMLVIPSRAESLPYVVLEAAAAGMPILSTRVGGIPEIFGPQAETLIAPDNVGVLAAAIGTALSRPHDVRRVADLVKARVRAEFSLPAMVDGGLAAYRDAIAMRKLAKFA
jgi:glycosyltransferase involved in cell wall biosynthesis